MATDRLAASLAATVQHDAEHTGLEHVEREQHDDGKSRAQVLFVATGKRAGAGNPWRPSCLLRSPARVPHIHGMVQKRTYYRDQGASGSLKM